jgi:micrococcal nuclease
VGLFRGNSQIGSAVLLLLVAVVLVRPWESWEGVGREEPSRAWAQVVRAIDGDTIEVRLDGRSEDVRYIGIDTPETVKPGTPVQCFGPRAHRFNARLVTGRRVRLDFDAERRDVYGRLLAYVHLGRRFVNAVLVRRGLARTLEIAPNTSFAPRFRRLEMAAARAGRGLWGAC